MTNFLNKIRLATAARAVKMIAGKEAWDMFNTTARRRPSLNIGSQNQDLDLGIKDDIVSDVRQLARVVGIVRKILRTFANHVVGSCEVNWSTGDPAWDLMAETRWKENMRTLDLSGRWHFRTLARLAVISTARDGDLGIAKNKMFGLRQIGLVESDRIRNFGNVSDYDVPSTGWISGVNTGPGGRINRFRVWDREEGPGSGFKNPREIGSQDMFLLQDPDRIDGVRGVSWFAYGGTNNLLDYKQLLSTEKKGVEANNRVAMIITKALGGVPTGGLNIWGNNSTEVSGTSNKSSVMEEIPSGMIKYTAPGEDVKSHQSNRPSPTFTGFLETIIQDIAVGLELPLGLVWKMAGSGPSVRFDMAQADRVFKEKFALMDFQFIRPVVQWCIAGDMEDGLLPFNPAWAEFEVQTPPSVTIDVGRESTADLAEHDRGLSSLTDLSAKRGKDAMKVLEAKAKEAKRAKELSIEYGVPISMILNIQAKTQIDGDPGSSPAPTQDRSKEQPKAEQLERPAPERPAPNRSKAEQPKTEKTEDKDKALLAQMNAFGVGVRAGVLTPTVEDENHFRKAAGLPPIAAATRSVWMNEPTRRPITITPPPGSTQAPAPATTTEDPEE